MSDLQNLFAALKKAAEHDLAANFAVPLQEAIHQAMTNGFNPAAIASQGAAIGAKLLDSGNQVLIDEGAALMFWSYNELGKVVSQFMPAASPVPGVSPAK